MQRPRAVGVVIVSLLFASSWGASIRAAEEEGSFQGEIMHVQRAEEKSSPKGFLGTLLVEKERSRPLTRCLSPSPRRQPSSVGLADFECPHPLSP